MKREPTRTKARAGTARGRRASAPRTPRIDDVLEKHPSSATDPRSLVQRVLATIDAIPRGRVASYGGVANQANLPRRARFVGRVLRELPAGSTLAWHRVVSSSGALGLRGAAAREQLRRLRREGIVLDARGRVPRERFVFVVESSSRKGTDTKAEPTDSRT